MILMSESGVITQPRVRGAGVCASALAAGVTILSAGCMLGAPNTHFVMLMQAILFRGAGIEAAWPQFAALAVMGVVLFGVSLTRFRRTLGSMA